MSKINSGEVVITLDGEERTLKPTLGAATRVNSRFAGFTKAVAEISALNLDAFVYVVGQGLAAKDDEMKVMKEKVWRTGLADLVGPVGRFVMILANGGRDLDEVEPDGDDEGNS